MKFPAMIHNWGKTRILCWAVVAGECFSTSIDLMVQKHWLAAGLVVALGVVAGILAYTGFDDMFLALHRVVREQITKELMSKR